MASDKLSKFLVDLAIDPLKLSAYLEDPEGTLEAANLDPGDADVLLSGNQAAIYARLKPPLPEDERSPVPSPGPESGPSVPGAADALPHAAPGYPWPPQQPWQYPWAAGAQPAYFVPGYIWWGWPAG